MERGPAVGMVFEPVFFDLGRGPGELVNKSTGISQMLRRGASLDGYSCNDTAPGAVEPREANGQGKS